MKIRFNSILIISIFLVFIGCDYYNIFFNAREAYDIASEKQKNNRDERLPADIRKDFNAAIKKCWKLIDYYGDSSRYADEALVIIGKSHYFLGEYPKSERVLEQFLDNYKQSDFVPEAHLWLARNYTELEKDEQAREQLNKIFELQVSNEIAASAFRILADLEFKREQYELAIENAEKSIEISDNEEEIGNAYFVMGEAFAILEQYENAIDSYDKIKKLDVPVILEFEASIEIVNNQIELERYDEAIGILKEMHRDQRFEKQFSLIDTKLANLYEIMGDYEFAIEQYGDVIENYKKSEGSALAAYYLAQLYEFEYGDFDSAKVYYGKVRSLYSKSDAVEDANKKVKLLDEYIKLRNGFRKDVDDLYRLSMGDSSLVEYIDQEDPDTEDTMNKDEDMQQPNLLEQAQNNQLGTNSFGNNQENGFNQFANVDTTNKDSLQQQDGFDTPAFKEKIAVSRNPEQVEISHRKNSFALAEYFLLKYQNFDSAAVRYDYFCNTFDDSLLTPKSYYSLYYIYDIEINDTIKADSIRNILLTRYSDTVYAEKLQVETNQISQSSETENSENRMKALYHQGESLIEDGQYTQAIDKFVAISDIDTASTWAQKAQYAKAYIYEKHMNDIPMALETYTYIASNYPNSEYSKIAKNKIKEPAPEPVLADSSVAAGDSSSVSGISGDQTDQTGLINGERQDKLSDENDTSPELTRDRNIQERNAKSKLDRERELLKNNTTNNQEDKLENEPDID